MKNIYNFSEKPELPKLILPVKISWLVFSAVSEVEMKNLQRLDEAHYLVSRLRHSISRSIAAMPRALVLQRDSACRLQ